MNTLDNKRCNRFTNHALLLQNLLDHNTKLGFIRNNTAGLMRDVKNERVAVHSENGVDVVVKLEFKKLS